MRCRTSLALLAVTVTAVVAQTAHTLPVHADDTTLSSSTLRNGWDPAQPDLTLAAVRGGGFHKLFRTPIDGVVFAQPVTAHSVVVATTEHNMVYGIDENNGGVRWARRVRTYEPDMPFGCNQVSPHVGITSTPVIDPAAGTVHVMPATGAAHRRRGGCGRWTYTPAPCGRAGR